MNNKHISNTTEASFEGLLNNCSQPNLSHATYNSYFTEKNFEDFVKDIIIENNSLYHDESIDSEYSASIPFMYIDNKNEKQQDVKCELAFTSYEKDVNVSESNSQAFTNTKLVDDKIVSMRTSFPSNVFPLMKILTPKSEPHICLEYCFKCNKVFRVLDSPKHITWIRSIDKKNAFFIIEPSLRDDSCLCDLCWKDLEKTYNSIKSNNRKKETYSEKKLRLLERYVKKNVSKNQNQARRCSTYKCSRSYCQKMPVNECENIKKLFLTIESFHLVFVQSKKQTKDFLNFPLRLCKTHRDMILVMSTCQICGDKLNAPFNTDDWSMYEIWNFVLIENHLPLILKPAMFICVTCKGYISNTNSSFPTTDLPRLRKYILKSNAIRLKLYGESQYDFLNICRRSTYLESPIVLPKTIEEKKCVHLTKVKFSDPLITTVYDYEIGGSKNDTTNLKEGNQCINKINTIPKTVYLNDTNNSTNSFIAAVEPHDAMTYPVSIKRKQSNVICDSISNKDVKKQRKNVKYSFYEKNYTDDNTTKFYKNKNMVHSSINPQSTFKMTHNCKNKYDSNSDISDPKMFSETNSKEILPDCGKEETDYTMVDSYDDSSLDYHCELIKSKFETKPAYEIEMDKNDTKSIISTTFLNVAEENLCTPKLELKDEGLYIVNYTDDNTTKFYKNKNMVHSSINPQSTFKMTHNCKNKYDSNSDISDPKMFSETNSKEILPDCGKEETDYTMVDSYDDSSLDYHCELIKSKFETKPAYEIEMDKNDTKSIISTTLLNVAEENLCTPKLELKDEGFYIVKLEEEYF